MTARTRLNVTTCLYLSPNNSARSLSTLIAVHVIRDSPHKAIVEKVYNIPALQFHIQCSRYDAAWSRLLLVNMALCMQQLVAETDKDLDVREGRDKQRTYHQNNIYIKRDVLNLEIPS